MTIAIQVENLGKQYLLNHQSKERYQTLRDTLAGGVKRWVGKLSGNVDPSHASSVEEFWALSGVDFEVRQGDRVGIIGRNGAGKSTLLKLLSRITEPTTGKVSIRGRVASLLEVGTGFHPELTGRENIYLNGAILGMSKQEIKRKFDEIVAFAEIEKFLDTPVKRYSSGMYVRLAFAVAAHLEPEILIVDEVLAVGDAQFQKKCLGQMEKVGNEGRTVLFVSHNMAMVSNLCQKGILFESGKLKYQGPISGAVLEYYQSTNAATNANSFESDSAVLLNAEIIGAGQHNELSIHDSIALNMRYRLKKNINGVSVPNFHFFSADGSCIFISNARDCKQLPAGEYIAQCMIPSNLLNEGTYFVGVALTTYYENAPLTVEFFDRNAVTFNVIDPMDELSSRYGYMGPIPGFLRPKLDWKITKVVS